MRFWFTIVLFLLAFTWFQEPIVWGETDPGDVAMLMKIQKGLANPELLQWPANDGDPCGNKWPHVYCSGNRVAQIQVQNVGLSGELPEDFNRLTELVNLGLQRNNFSGKLPSFSGLSKLQYAYLNENQFNSIPLDFFDGLASLEVLSLSKNPLNESGWMIPASLGDSAELRNLSLVDCNLLGPLPDFLGSLLSLTVLHLSYNELYGKIPSSYGDLPLQILWLNDQKGKQISGTIDVITSMTMLREAWLHGNAFTGTIPSSIDQLISLQRLWLNNNQLFGVIPENLASLNQLESLRLDNNFLVGPIPKTSIANFSYANNPTCQDTPGLPCAPEVRVLLDFLDSVNYPASLARSWSGNDPCTGWLGVSCSGANVSTINLSNFSLNGTINPSLASLHSLMNVHLQENHLSGTIPADLADLSSLKLLNLSSNNLEPPVPKFTSSVKLYVDNNPLIQHPGFPTASVPAGLPSADFPGDSSSTPSKLNNSSSSKKLKHLLIIIPIVIGIIIILIVCLLLYLCHQKKQSPLATSSVVLHLRDPSNGNLVKVVIADKNSNVSTLSSDPHHRSYSGTNQSHATESGNLAIPVQTLRYATHNFSHECELGRGGFGVVYKGELLDGTMIAVKRMEFSMTSTEVLDEFLAEILVLSKVKHRNLVSLLGYSVEENEKLLVYEYMPQGDLNRYLFRWKELGLNPLSWKRRLNIALDVARAMEYLHSLVPNQGYIHRDLKSSNILLDDDFHAKVSDFGLAKLAPQGDHSMLTKVAGTVGYVAPEYAVTGKVTTKVDIFSFGVVLLELVTGLAVIDQNRSDEKQYLVSWFSKQKWNQEKLKDAIDHQIDASCQETFQSICKVIELASYCTAREPSQRPEMGHAVNVLASMLQRWKPGDYEPDRKFGIDVSQPLLQIVKEWEEDTPTQTLNSQTVDDSTGSIPPMPIDHADTLTAYGGR